MNSSLKRQLLRTFVQMIDDLKDKKEIEKFLTDFFSEVEFEKYIKRLAISYWLKKGRDKENIKRNLLATPKEIIEAEKLLKKEGVKLAIKKIEADEWANQWSEKIKSYTKTNK
jgi:uncharacterized protein YerC